MNMLIPKVKETIKKYGMLKKGDSVVVAVSGGADSVALLYALLGLKDELKLKLIVCHLDHGLRARESRRDYEFVERLSNKLGLAFVGGRLQQGELKKEKRSLQDAARRRRYEFLDNAARLHSAKKIALGHTQDDTAETVLMRLVKGSGLAGLSGIPPVRGKYIRPLIETSRKEIEEFIGHGKLRFVVDSSNLKTDYLRNSFRLELIPFIKDKYNPAIIETLSRTAESLRADNSFVEGEADRVFKDSFLVEKTRDSVILDRAKLAKAHSALAGRALSRAIDELNVKTDIYSDHIISFLKLIKGSAPNASIALPAGLILRREYDKIILAAVKTQARTIFEQELMIPGKTEMKEIDKALMSSIIKKIPKKLPQGDNIAFFDLDAIKGGLTVRPFRAGDRMRPFGMKGHKKLKDIFIDKKVPITLRPLLPIVCAGEDIIWVAGIKRSDLYRITPATKRALRIELEPVRD